MSIRFFLTVLLRRSSLILFHLVGFNDHAIHRRPSSATIVAAVVVVTPLMPII